MSPDRRRILWHTLQDNLWNTSASRGFWASFQPKLRATMPPRQRPTRPSMDPGELQKADRGLKFASAAARSDGMMCAILTGIRHRHHQEFVMIRMIAIAAFSTLLCREAFAAPSAEVAKKCVHFSYLAYPFKRPGQVRASGDRQAYYKACIEKDGNVPEPAKP
jgi:hypothetical protein